jgi:hypothetical protein
MKVTNRSVSQGTRFHESGGRSSSSSHLFGPDHKPLERFLVAVVDFVQGLIQKVGSWDQAMRSSAGAVPEPSGGLERFFAPTRAAPNNEVTTLEKLLNSEQPPMEGLVAMSGSPAAGSFDASGLTALMRGRKFMMLVRQNGAQSKVSVVINDSVDLFKPTALLLYEPHQAHPEQALRPLLERDWASLVAHDPKTTQVALSPRPYVEPQQAAQCGRHALNMCLGAPVFSEQVLRDWVPSGALDDSGMMNMSVVAKGLQMYAPRTQLVTGAQPEFANFVDESPHGAGVVVFDPDKKHFLCFKKWGDSWVRLDSVEVPSDPKARANWTPPVGSPVDYVAGRASNARLANSKIHFEIALVPVGPASEGGASFLEHAPVPPGRDLSWPRCRL